MKESEEIKEGLDFINKNGLSHLLVQQACTHLSISQDNLIPKTLQDFFSSGSKEIAEIHLRHYEARRRAKLILISKYIYEKSQSPSNKTLQIMRTVSTSSTKQAKSVISPSSLSNSKIEVMKKNLMKKLKVAKNLQTIKKEEEKRRKIFEDKILAKSCRSERKQTPEQTNRFALHDLRVKEILSKKYKDIEEHERRAISSISTNRKVYKTYSSSFQSSKKKHSKLPEINIEQKLQEFNQKMSKSSERAKKALMAKATSVNTLSRNVKKASTTKEEIDSKTEQQALDRIIKIGKNIKDSTRRREEFLENEQKRISLSLNSQKTRWNQEMLKIDKVKADREKHLQEKTLHKEKLAKMIKHSLDRELQETHTRNSIRKRRDHEMNLNRIQRQYEKIKSKMIEKVKEDKNKQKPEMNIEKLRSKLETKLMSQLNL